MGPRGPAPAIGVRVELPSVIWKARIMKKEREREREVRLR